MSAPGSVHAKAIILQAGCCSDCRSRRKRFRLNSSLWNFPPALAALQIGSKQNNAMSKTATSPPANRINVIALIDRQPVTGYQIGVLALCMLAAALDGFDTQAIGYTAPAIAAELQLPMAQFGEVGSAGLVGAAVGALVLRRCRQPSWRPPRPRGRASRL
jgi:hypothetical protein